MQEDNKLARWLAGEMPEDELRMFEKTPEYADYVRIISTTAEFSAPAFDEASQYQALAARRRQPKVVPLFNKTWLRIAAAIVILLGIGAYVMMTMPVIKEAGASQQLAFTLPDNSEVILNAGSTASYVKNDWSDNRRITLDGEALFKVAKGKSFEVETSLGTVAVLGTQFNVKARAGRLDVDCFEGRVSVMSAGKEIIISKGQSVTFEDGAPTGIKEIQDTAPSWMGDHLRFEKETLAQIVAELERQYAVTIETRGSPRSQRFTGSLPKNNLDQALKVICDTFHLKSEESENKISLTPVDDR